MVYFPVYGKYTVYAICQSSKFQNHPYQIIIISGYVFFCMFVHEIITGFDITDYQLPGIVQIVYSICGKAYDAKDIKPVNFL